MPNQQSTACYELSIIVVSYNTKEMTQECLQSIYTNAGETSLEVIVVDNNSQDGTVEMLAAQFPQVRLVRNRENRGFAVANNQGLAIVQGKYILLLNSDTIILGNVLIDSVRYLACNSKIGAIGCQVLNSDRTIQKTCSGFPTLLRLLIMTLALDRIPFCSILDTYLLRSWPRDNEREVEVISGCYLMVRKDVIERVGGLDEQFFFFAEETDWCHRIQQAGWKLMFVPVGNIIHHGGGSVKKLNYKLDVLLTAAIVRLHRKHGGFLFAVMVYLALMTFNVSRATLWSLVAFQNTSKRSRANYFINIVRSYRECWPN